MIPYGRQWIDDDDIEAVVKALRSERITQGPAIEEFEATLTGVTGAAHAVAFSSGTAALHAACAAAGLGTGDLVATSALTFAASANCARYVGADVCLVDIDPGTLNLDLDRIPQDVSALVAVHYAGLPVDLRLLKRRPRVVIEDAAHALGANTPDGPVGNCAHSDMAVFSFHPVKVVTTAEGGAVTTNDPVLADRLRRFRSHGTVPTPDRGGWAYDVASLGFNYRLTDIQAALGTSQMRKLAHFVRLRQERAAEYRRLLAGLPVKLPPEPSAGFTHAYHLFPVQVANRAAVYARMRRAGIGVQVHYVPVYLHSSFSGPGFDPASFPATGKAYAGLLSIPLFPAMTDEEQKRVASELERSL